MSKKFKYLRNEAVNSCNILINLINIFDKRGVENFLKSWEEIPYLLERPSTVSELKHNFTPICVILKSTPNFLLKLNEKNIILDFKKSLSSIGLTKIMEVDDEAVFDTDSFIQDIIYLCN
jgi:hypothetical protein